jgi:chromosome segregation ATPase
MFERVSREARSAEERAERVASDLRETQRLLGEAQEQLRAEQDLGRIAMADLERAVAERDATRAQVVSLHEELTQAKGTIASVEAALGAKDEQLRAAAERTSSLQAELARQAASVQAELDQRTASLQAELDQRTASLQAELDQRTRERDELAATAQTDRDGSTGLEAALLERNQQLAAAQEEASRAQVWLRRALEESAEYKKSLAAEQARVVELEELAATYRAELEERSTAPGEQPVEPGEGPSSASELAAVLQVTEQAVVRIMESTKARADEELRSIDRDRERIGREVEAMREWRDRAAPMIASLRSTMDEVLGHVNEVGVRVNEVLRPVSGAVTRLSSQLASLDGLPREIRIEQDEEPEPSGGARVIELRDEQAAARDRWRDG